MRNNLEKFLLDKNRNKEIFEDSLANKYVVYKEKYNDRFDVIYYKRYTNSISQRDYDIGGYFDSKEKVLYEPNYNIQNMFLIDNKIRFSHFSDVEQKIKLELVEKVNKYLKDNFNTIKKDGKIKFEYLTSYDIERMKSEVNTQYIIQSEPRLDLFFNIDNTIIHKLKIYKEENYLLKYFEDKDKLIDSFFNEIITISKEDLGFTALKYDYMNKYLEELKSSKSGKYTQLNINRNIYQSIKDIYAKTININIGYGENNISFKFDFEDFKRALSRNDKGTSAYGVAYKRVSEFIKNNKPTDNRYYNDFEFSHINFITYGKDEIYNKKNFEIIKQKKVRNYER